MATGIGTCIYDIHNYHKENSVCCLWKKQESDKHCVRLFKKDKGSELCLLIETYLEIQLLEHQNINSVCQVCHRMCSQRGLVIN